MPIISFANSKGGSGKTTSALLLACELAQSKPVTIIDADPRQPITRWASLPNFPANVTVTQTGGEKTIVDEIELAASQTPFVIIDLEGTASRLMSYAVSSSDLVIIPTKEQQQDAIAAIEVIKEIHRDMKVIRRPIPYSVLFTQTRVIAKSRTARMIADQFRTNAQIDTFASEINDRDAFSALFAIGGTIRSMKSKDVNNLEAAIRNVEDYTAEVVAKLRANRERVKEVA